MGSVGRAFKAFSRVGKAGEEAGHFKNIFRGGERMEDFIARFKNIFRGAERAEETAEEVGKVGKKISSAAEDVEEGAWQTLKKGFKRIGSAGTAIFGLAPLLLYTRIADDINETFNSPHAAKIVSAILGIVVVIVGYLIFKKFASGAKKVGELATSAKNKIKSGGGVKKLSDTVCFFILISFIFIINFLYEKFLELEKEKEKINQLDHQSTQNY